jgi:formylglycine-generating enzyme required for sulfatase activity
MILKDRQLLEGEILLPLQKYFAPLIPRCGIGALTTKVRRGLFTEQHLIGSFEICRFQTTKKEWRKVFWWSIENEYEFHKGYAEGDNYPVTNVSMYDCLAWCNARSEMENLNPCYYLAGEVLRNSKTLKDRYAENIVNFQADSNGYRLPNWYEWYWAANGCNRESNLMYSGSNNVDQVAWCNINTNGGSKPVGKKHPNAIGMHDMSGNVWEWIWNKSYDVTPCLGGCWSSDPEECLLNPPLEYKYKPQSFYSNDKIGFRYVRSLDYLEQEIVSFENIDSYEVDKIIKLLSPSC